MKIIKGIHNNIRPYIQIQFENEASQFFKESISILERSRSEKMIIRELQSKSCYLTPQSHAIDNTIADILRGNILTLSEKKQRS